jgi:hypothetical protein
MDAMDINARKKGKNSNTLENYHIYLISESNLSVNDSLIAIFQYLKCYTICTPDISTELKSITINKQQSL